MEMKEMLTLAEVRTEIDRVDSEIKRLFEERMMLADNIARVKAETADAIFKPDREVAIIERLTNGVEPSILKEYTALIKRIMEISRKYQYGRTLQLRDCLDVEYVTEEQDIKNAGMLKNELYICTGISKDSIRTFTNYTELAKALAEDEIDAGIGIMEEIGVGVSDAFHAMLEENSFYICRCDTVKDDGCLKKVVAFTKKLIVLPDHNRLKVEFVCHNKSGSLASVLSMVGDYGVNLTEIHSKPDRNPEWNYIFTMELEACFMEQEIKALIFQLMNETEYFKILGSYRF